MEYKELESSLNKRGGGLPRCGGKWGWGFIIHFKIPVIIHSFN